MSEESYQNPGKSQDDFYADYRCIHCGKCCIIHWNGKSKPCPNLIKVTDTKYFCRHYKDRLGKIIGKIDGQKFTCISRRDSRYDYEGCPMNTDKEVVIHNDK